MTKVTFLPNEEDAIKVFHRLNEVFPKCEFIVQYNEEDDVYGIFVTSNVSEQILTNITFYLRGLETEMYSD